MMIMFLLVSPLSSYNAKGVKYDVGISIFGHISAKYWWILLQYGSFDSADSANSDSDKTIPN